jgi:hypothetical protein
MDEKRQSISAKASKQPPLPTFHRQYEFLIWLQIFLFVCIFFGIGAYHLIGLNSDYWKTTENDFIHYSKRISPIAPEIISGHQGFGFREMLDSPEVQNIKGEI